MSSERFYNLSEENAENISYDAYDKDIAMVQVFFKTATVVQIGSQPRYSMHLKASHLHTGRFPFPSTNTCQNKSIQ
jgi:hypothetical protein